MRAKQNARYAAPRNIAVALTALLVCCALIAGWGGQQPDRKQARPSTEQVGASRQSTTEGRQFFEGRCAACHGIDGRGGERAPDIATNPKAQGLSDGELARIIHEGVPTAGMPGFSTLDKSTTNSLIAYLRFLQGQRASAPLPGSAQAGRALFFGAARCSQCHTINGLGGFIAPDLTAYGRTHSAEEIREAVLKPNQSSSGKASTVTVTTREGRTFEGVARNEDNFSLQIESLDGLFHFFMKSDLASIERSANSLMPADYGTRLSAGDLDDLVKFLASVGSSSKKSGGEQRPPDEDEDEKEE